MLALLVSLSCFYYFSSWYSYVMVFVA